jgi:hypothetical protein
VDFDELLISIDVAALLGLFPVDAFNGRRTLFCR